LIWMPAGLQGRDAAVSSEPLALPDLEQVVAHVAARTELWEPLLDRTTGERAYASLYRDARVDIWAIVWYPDSDTGWHDHDTSSGAVQVVEGALVEHGLRVGAPERERHYAAGETFSFGPSHIHRLTCASDTAVSIHAYSSPLWRLGQYTLDEDGALHRVSVSYADELRPMEAVAA
jgi:predicted metal-dependent enzyme (double-stranded beta helix superfamily)